MPTCIYRNTYKYMHIARKYCIKCILLKCLWKMYFTKKYAWIAKMFTSQLIQFALKYFDISSLYLQYDIINAL